MFKWKMMSILPWILACIIVMREDIDLFRIEST